MDKTVNPYADWEVVSEDQEPQKKPQVQSEPVDYSKWEVVSEVPRAQAVTAKEQAQPIDYSDWEIVGEVPAEKKEEPGFFSELGKAVVGGFKTQLPSMFEQAKLSGTSQQLVKNQSLVDLYKKIDEGKLKTQEELESDPSYKQLLNSGGNPLDVSLYKRLGKENRQKLLEESKSQYEGAMSDAKTQLNILDEYTKEYKEKYDPAVSKFTDINFTDPRVMSDFKAWLGSTIGSAASQYAPAIAAGLVFKVPGALAASVGMNLSEAIQNRIEFLDNQTKGLSAEEKAKVVASYINDTRDVNMAVGVAGGALDALFGPEARIAKGIILKDIKDQGVKQAIKEVAKELPKDILTEGLTEGAQEAQQIAAKKYLKEQGLPITTENILDVVNSMAAGAAGAPLGTVAHAGIKGIKERMAAREEAARAEEKAPTAERAEPTITPEGMPAEEDRVEPAITPIEEVPAEKARIEPTISREETPAEKERVEPKILKEEVPTKEDELGLPALEHFEEIPDVTEAIETKQAEEKRPKQPEGAAAPLTYVRDDIAPGTSIGKDTFAGVMPKTSYSPFITPSNGVGLVEKRAGEKEQVHVLTNNGTLELAENVTPDMQWSGDKDTAQAAYDLIKEINALPYASEERIKLEDTLHDFVEDTRPVPEARAEEAQVEAITPDEAEPKAIAPEVTPVEKTKVTTEKARPALEEVAPGETRTAEAFIEKAREAHRNKEISDDVIGVLNNLYETNKPVLEGLSLNIENQPEGIAAQGEYVPVSRIINLYKDTSGVKDAQAVRNEISHSLEQMMTNEQRAKVVDAWGEALDKASKKNKDQAHQSYFDAVRAYFTQPTNENRARAEASLPSRDMYQYMNPSEYWSENAGNLLRSELGGSWDKFKKTISGLYESIKNVLGFDNKSAIHKVFDELMSSPKERKGEMLTRQEGRFFSLDKDLDDLKKKYDRPDTPTDTDRTILQSITTAGKNIGDSFRKIAKSPLETASNVAGSLDEQAIKRLNDISFYGKGLNEADRKAANGQIRYANGMVIASVALDNAIRADMIGANVLFKGGIEFDKASGTLMAVEKPYSMKNVYVLAKEIQDRLGNQRGTDAINGYLEAKRSASIVEAYEITHKAYKKADADLKAAKDLAKADIEAAKREMNRRMRKEENKLAVYKEFAKKKSEAMKPVKLAENAKENMASELKEVNRAFQAVTMTKQAISEYSALDKKIPELKEILDNWSKVNRNMLDMLRDVGMLSNARYQRLLQIKDYVPWQRMVGDTDSVTGYGASTRTLTGIGDLYTFGKSKPVKITEFVAKEGQKEIKINLSSDVKVKVNGSTLSSDLYKISGDGMVTFEGGLKKGDQVKIEGIPYIGNIIDNMTNNVMRMTVNGLRKYAEAKIVNQYATRTADGKIATFSRVDPDKGRFTFKFRGEKMIVEIADPNVAASIYGMDKIEMAAPAIISGAANLFRRGITLSVLFQAAQVVKDSASLALLTRTKNPIETMGKVWYKFAQALVDPAMEKFLGKGNPTLELLKNAGIGGHHGPERGARSTLGYRMGVLNGRIDKAIISALDYVGDASDIAQRATIYEQTLKQTKDKGLALYNAANIINFKKYGAAREVQAAVKVVPFLNAYIQATDVMMQAYITQKGITGKSRAENAKRTLINMLQLSGATLVYLMLVSGTDDYEEADDETKYKNIIIPGVGIKIPINTSATVPFKMLTEIAYNTVMSSIGKTEEDVKKIKKALSLAMSEFILNAPTSPALITPALEIKFNHNFFTQKPITPPYMKTEAVEQYTAQTSELGKSLSKLTGGSLNPMEMDHLLKGIFGSSAAMTMWFTNEIFSEGRVAPEKRNNPFYGRFLTSDVPNKNEMLFYDYKDEIEKQKATLDKYIKEKRYEDVLELRDKYPTLDAEVSFVNNKTQQIKNDNEQKRKIELNQAYSPEEKRELINNIERRKEQYLQSVMFRRQIFFGEPPKLSGLLKK